MLSLLLPVIAVATLFSTSTPVGSWNVVVIDHINGLTQAQGLATVIRADGSTFLHYDGDNVPAAKQTAGWGHVGDPDSSRGYIFEPYQASDAATAAKMFAVTAPDGTETDFVHHDLAGEEYNNSFAAVSPDSQWMVAGEWDQMTRLLVFPTPILNPAATDAAADLPVVAQIDLDTTVVDIQGCTFQSPTRLFCSSDDPVAQNGLPRKALLQLDLDHPLDGHDVAGHVTPLFALPVPQSSCPITAPGSWPGDMEIEGVDFDRVRGELRVEIIPPGICGGNARVYVYRDTAPTGAEPTTTAPTTVVPTTVAPTTVAPTSVASTTVVPTTTSSSAPAVNGASVSPAPAAVATAGSLPATGSATGPLLILAVCLISGGLVLAVSQRSGRRPS